MLLTLLLGPRVLAGQFHQLIAGSWLAALLKLAFVQVLDVLILFILNEILHAANVPVDLILLVLHHDLLFVSGTTLLYNLLILSLFWILFELGEVFARLSVEVVASCLHLLIPFDGLHLELENGAANLQNARLVRTQSDFVLHHNQGAELAVSVDCFEALPIKFYRKVISGS